MDEQLTNELSEIFARCQKDEKGEVEINTLIEVFVEKYGDPDHLREYMVAKFGPYGLNDRISERKLVDIMKSIIDQEDESDACFESPIMPPLPPTYCSTPKAMELKRRPIEVRHRFKNQSDELSISAIGDSSASSGMSSAIQKSVVACIKLKNQELLDRLVKTEMVNLSIEARLKSETASLQATKKENLKLKEELNRLRSLEEMKLEESTRAEELEKLYEKKCHDLEKANKLVFNLEEKLSDLENSHREALIRLKSTAKIVNDQTATVQSLHAELAQAKRDYEQLEKEYELQANKLISVELDRQTLADRISQVANEKQDLAMKLAELSAFQTLPCLNYSDDTSCEAMMPLTEISTRNDFHSLHHELELKSVSLMCHSADSSSDNLQSDRPVPIEVAVQTSFPDPELRETHTQTEFSQNDGSVQTGDVDDTYPVDADVTYDTAFVTAFDFSSTETVDDSYSVEADVTYEAAFISAYESPRFEDRLVCCSPTSDMARRLTPPDSPQPQAVATKMSSDDVSDVSNLDITRLSEYSDSRTDHVFCVSRHVPPPGSECSNSAQWHNRRYTRTVVTSVVLSLLCALVVSTALQFPAWSFLSACGPPSSCRTSGSLLSWLFRLDLPWAVVRLHYDGPPPM